MQYGVETSAISAMRQALQQNPIRLVDAVDSAAVYDRLEKDNPDGKLVFPGSPGKVPVLSLS